ncbi:hypothetical protein [Tomitella cavernea]|uniref:CsbD family protein n=1 Tax=Tomitella cavernea TaxID=1387982 RepID=A0ABP9D7D3_9ACTN|nr:hypothetical protein [Tomitella cavernea]
MQIGEQIGAKAAELKQRVTATAADDGQGTDGGASSGDGTVGGLRAKTAAMIDKIVRHDDGPW